MGLVYFLARQDKTRRDKTRQCVALRQPGKTRKVSLVLKNTCESEVLTFISRILIWNFSFRVFVSCLMSSNIRPRYIENVKYWVWSTFRIFRCHAAANIMLYWHVIYRQCVLLNPPWFCKLGIFDVFATKLPLNISWHLCWPETSPQ